MRVLVCGGRNYDNRDLVWRALDQYQENYGPLTVIQGGAMRFNNQHNQHEN